MKERYNDNITSFNKTYNSSFASFDDLLKAVDWRPGADLSNDKETDDNFAFLLKVIDKRYKIQCETIKKYDPNHMILGDKINGNTDTPKEIVEITSQYTDVVFYGHYGILDEHIKLIDNWKTVTDKPFYSADASFSVPSPNMPMPFGPHCTSQEERARIVLDTFNCLYAREDFIGWDWCGWMDHWCRDNELDGTHSGLQTPFGDIYLPMQEALSGFSQDIFDIAQRNCGRE